MDIRSLVDFRYAYYQRDGIQHTGYRAYHPELGMDQEHDTGDQAESEVIIYY